MRKNSVVPFCLFLVFAMALLGCGSTGGGGGGGFTRFGGHGTGDGQFDNPQGIAVDSSGNIYVADFGNSRIQKFNTGLSFVSKVDFSTIADWGPHGLEVFGDHLYACDPGQQRIQVFSLDLEYQRFWNVPWSTEHDQTAIPVDIDFDLFGYAYVLDNANRRVIKMDPSTGAEILRFGSLGAGDAQLNDPNCLCVFGNYVYVADTNNDRVNVFDLSGNPARRWGSTGSASGQFENPQGIDSLGGDNIVVGDINLAPTFARLQKFTTDGTYVSTSQPNSGGFYAKFLAVDNNNSKIYICDDASSDSIMVIDTF